MIVVENMGLPFAARVELPAASGTPPALENADVRWAGFGTPRPGAVRELTSPQTTHVEESTHMGEDEAAIAATVGWARQGQADLASRHRQIGPVDADGYATWAEHLPGDGGTRV